MLVKQKKGRVVVSASALLLVLTGSLYAQSVVSPAVNPEQAHAVASKWILDVDPKHRAWAAELIAQYRLGNLYPKLVTQLEEFQPSSSEVFQGSADELALEAIVDAIIKVQLRVPTQDARKLYRAFPALAIILLASASDDNRSVLYSIFNEATTGEVWLAAADLLAERPPPGFVSKLLTDFNEFVRILVFASGNGGGMSYGDCFSAQEHSSFSVPPGWPVIEIYSLQTAVHGGTIIASGENSVSFVSRESSDCTPWKGRSGCGGLDLQSLRHDLIAQLAGVDPGKVGLRSAILTNLTWKDDQAYVNEVNDLLQAQAGAFGGVIRELISKKLLTRDEGNSLRLHVELHVIPEDLPKVLPALPKKRTRRSRRKSVTHNVTEEGLSNLSVGLRAVSLRFGSAPALRCLGGITGAADIHDSLHSAGIFCEGTSG